MSHQKRKQDDYPPQAPISYHQSPPTPQMVEPVKNGQKGNAILMVLYVILLPFAKLFEFLRYLIKIILEEMLRGIIRFIFGLIFLALFFLMLAAFFVYVVAFFQVGLDFNEAFPRTIEIITGLLPF